MHICTLHMAQDIEVFCTSCGVCGAAKDNNSKLKGLLHGLPILDRPWQSIGMKFMGPLPQSNNQLFIGHDRPINFISTPCANHDDSDSQRHHVVNPQRGC